MKTMPLILLAVFVSAAAQLLLKAGMNRIGFFNFSSSNIVPVALQVATNPFVIFGLALYVFSFVIWLLVLSRTEVSIAYPMMSLAYIINCIAAYYFFNEDLSLIKISAVGVIVFGVYLLARS